MPKRKRVLFSHFSEDPWVMEVARDLSGFFRKENIEFFEIGGAKNRVDGANINYYRLLKSMNFSFSPFSLMDLKSKAISRLKEIEFEYYKRKSISSDFNKVSNRINKDYRESLFILKTLKPDVVLVWNGQMRKNGVMAIAAKDMGIPVYYAEKGMLPNSWYIDPKGVNASSSIASSRMDLSDISNDDVEDFKKQIFSIDKSGSSSWEQPDRKGPKQIRKQLKIGKEQKIVFFPGQVDSDTNIIIYSPQFDHVKDALKWLSDNISEKEFFILAKPHPKGSDSIEDYQTILGKKGRAMAELNIIDAIEISDIIITINSTVAFEGAIRGKPVFLLGKSILDAYDFVFKINGKQDLNAQLRRSVKRYYENGDSNLNDSIRFGSYLATQLYFYKGAPINKNDIMADMMGNT